MPQKLHVTEIKRTHRNTFSVPNWLSIFSSNQSDTIPKCNQYAKSSQSGNNWIIHTLVRMRTTEYARNGIATANFLHSPENPPNLYVVHKYCTSTLSSAWQRAARIYIYIIYVFRTRATQHRQFIAIAFFVQTTKCTNTCGVVSITHRQTDSYA